MYHNFWLISLHILVETTLQHDLKFLEIDRKVKLLEENIRKREIERINTIESQEHNKDLEIDIMYEQKLKKKKVSLWQMKL